MKFKSRSMFKSRGTTDISAGSSADIAFLLLIFFLVATIIDTDKGIPVKLPSMEAKAGGIPDRNLMKVLVNGQDEILIEGEPTLLTDIQDRILDHVLNYGIEPTLSTQPKSAVVSLQNDRRTTYNTYIQVHNEVKAAYSKIWNKAAMGSYRMSFDQLEPKDQMQIMLDFPMNFSEAEPYADATAP